MLEEVAKEVACEAISEAGLNACGIGTLTVALSPFLGPLAIPAAIAISTVTKEGVKRAMSDHDKDDHDKDKW